ncbi:carboxymuconolactone decarboxylase family protein [Dyella flava]|uniref:Carboxymuconolactone decarboxylase family protein n=1 Tax=Dyella flava TaxID=1920170 RepID=A0ABS2K6H4_9GAMM|nr:carboxymuconolactone decarboxylase family protein [Dyella flava]MBM7126759.1 carboxymuconolactone decarboxylase family protein [Dyella flava]GLQ49418.1 alkyl hydroperoxide reductase AhpD [Dyella flava]
MSRLHTIEINEATGETAQLFGAIKKAIGTVPNAYRALGSNAPAVLGHVLQTGAVLKQGELSAREQEAINLSVSEASACDYCLAAHSLTGKMAGLSAEQIQEARKGSFSADAKIDALVKFAVRLVKTSGTLPADAVESVKQAGYNDRQIVEAILAVSAILFTNMLNRVNDTVLDFPKAA